MIFIKQKCMVILDRYKINKNKQYYYEQKWNDNQPNYRWYSRKKNNKTMYNNKYFNQNSATTSVGKEKTKHISANPTKVRINKIYIHVIKIKIWVIVVVVVQQQFEPFFLGGTIGKASFSIAAFFGSFLAIHIHIHIHGK